MSVADIIGSAAIPKMVEVRQTFEDQHIPAEQIASVVYEQLSQPKFRDLIQPGKRICITAGSRGICNIVAILKSIADFCKEKGGRPFLVPAMGSHAGATAEGQLEMLEHLGITEESTGCPILSSMETVMHGTTDDG